MKDLLQPLLSKAQIVGLRVNVSRLGLCIGDVAYLRMTEGGTIGLFAKGRRGWLGLFSHKSVYLGQLGPTASGILTEPMRQNMHLRVRIVAITPEHLSATRQSEIYVSVWGAVDRMLGVTPAINRQLSYRT